MKKLLAIGEALIDFIPAQRDCLLKEVEQFTRVCGGAPANVAAAAAKLGGDSSLISQLGRDAFGDYIVDTLADAGVDTGKICRTDRANTALAFVSLKADGNRDFSFYRKPSADMLLEPEQLEEAWFANAGVLHFGSVSLIDAPIQKTHRRAISLAKEHGAIVSFDPNIRLPLWDSPETCQARVQEFLPFADIVKLSDEELEFVTGESDIRTAAAVCRRLSGHSVFHGQGRRYAAHPAGQLDREKSGSHRQGYHRRRGCHYGRTALLSDSRRCDEGQSGKGDAGAVAGMADIRRSLRQLQRDRKRCNCILSDPRCISGLGIAAL